MFECMIAAEKECTEHEDIKPDKVLRPIGTTWREWFEPKDSTDLPHWITWKVIGYIETYRGQRGNTLLYERMESIGLA